MTNSQRFEEAFRKAKINVDHVSVLGSYVHISSYKKYRDQLIHVMTSAGFKPIYERDGIHMDDYVGYRISFKLT